MIIKQYGGLPTTYAPDIGEVVEAKRAGGDKYTLAVVLHVSRRRDGALKVKVQWIADDPDAGSVRPDRARIPIVSGSVDHIVVSDDGPPLIRQINGGTPPAP